MGYRYAICTATKKECIRYVKGKCATRQNGHANAHQDLPILYTLANEIFEKNIEDMNMEELISLIREFHQIIIYTVNKDWVVQLLDLFMCGNDEGKCDWENSDTELIKVLRKAVEYISECIHDRNRD